jgi:hypothetical protein
MFPRCPGRNALEASPYEARRRAPGSSGTSPALSLYFFQRRFVTGHELQSCRSSVIKNRALAPEVFVLCRSALSTGFLELENVPSVPDGPTEAHTCVPILLYQPQRLPTTIFERAESFMRSKGTGGQV